MSFYQKVADIGQRFIRKSTLFKYGFNWSPMYKRSTGKIQYVSDDLMDVRIKLPLSYKNRNYVNSIFGGSMFSAVDPIPMVQLINIIGKDYIVWDKSAAIKFRRPAREDAFAVFSYTKDEIDAIKSTLYSQDEMEIIKTTHLTNKDQTEIFCTIDKTIYIANKAFYLAKKRAQKTMT